MCKVDERKNGRHEDMKTTQPRSNRRKGLTTRLKGQRSPEEDNTITRTKDTKTRRHGTDVTNIIDNNQITRRNNFRSEEVFPRPWNVAIDYVPDVTPYPRIRIFFNPQLFFFCGYGFRPHVSGESVRHTNPQLSRVEIFEYALNANICGR